MPADWSLGSVSHFSYRRLNDVPTAVSGAVMQDYAQEALWEIAAYFQTTISNTAIDDQYKPILVNMTCAYVLARMAQVGIDFDATIGAFSVSKGSSTNYDKRIDYYTKKAEDGLKAIGRRTHFYQAFF